MWQFNNRWTAREQSIRAPFISRRERAGYRIPAGPVARTRLQVLTRSACNFLGLIRLGNFHGSHGLPPKAWPRPQQGPRRLRLAPRSHHSARSEGQPWPSLCSVGPRHRLHSDSSLCLAHLFVRDRAEFSKHSISTPTNAAFPSVILQWSQKPGQLHRFLQACSTREPAEWARIMGGGSLAANAVLEYTARPNGGLDSRGSAIDPAFELTKDPWRSKLQALGTSLPMQRIQLDLAAEIYRTELARETGYAGKTTSERGFAFLLDLANQFGSARVERAI